MEPARFITSFVLLVLGGLVSNIWIQADSEIIWIIGFFAASIFITLCVLWFWNFMKTESLLRNYRFQYPDGL